MSGKGCEHCEGGKYVADDGICPHCGLDNNVARPGHRPYVTIPYGGEPVVCECGVLLDYDGDHTEQMWSAADGSTAPCPVWDGITRTL